MEQLKELSKKGEYINTMSSKESIGLRYDLMNDLLIYHYYYYYYIESFAHKAKFPPALRPLTLDIGRLMFREDDNNVVNHLMKILPYNRFTLNVSFIFLG